MSCRDAHFSPKRAGSPLRVFPALIATQVCLGAHAALAGEPRLAAAGSLVIEVRPGVEDGVVQCDDGTFWIRGQPHRFRISGLNARMRRPSAVKLQGTVYDLDSPARFFGRYVLAPPDARIAGTPLGKIWLRHEHGVRIEFTLKRRGATLWTAEEGALVTIE